MCAQDTEPTPLLTTTQKRHPLTADVMLDSIKYEYVDPAIGIELLNHWYWIAVPVAMTLNVSVAPLAV